MEDGFDFATNVQALSVAPGAVVSLEASGRESSQHELPVGNDVARLWYTTSSDARLVRATVPGAPGMGEAQRHWLEVQGSSGRVVGVWSWPRADGLVVRSVEFPIDTPHVAAITTVDGTVASHGPAAHGWHIELDAGGARSSIDLEGLLIEAPRSDDEGSATPERVAEVAVDFEVPLVDQDLIDDTPGEFIEEALLLPLGAVHYLQTEASWTEAGEPTATLQLARTETHLIADVAVATGPVVAQQRGENGMLDNPFDNERPDVDADGLQWYIGAPDAGRWTDAGLVAAADADESGEVGWPRMHALIPGSPCEVSVNWTETDEGWAMRLLWPLDLLPIDADGCIAFDLLINERSPDRQRRRGQLVLSGGGGFAYVRGDRHDPAHALVIAVT